MVHRSREVPTDFTSHFAELMIFTSGEGKFPLFAPDFSFSFHKEVSSSTASAHLEPNFSLPQT